MNLSLVILAGGRSSRMGRDKADLLCHGKTFLQTQIDKGRALGIQDILISGYRGTGLGFPVVSDRYPDKGPLGGLEACFRKAQEPYCLVLSVDAPLVPVSELARLIKAFEKSEKKALILKSRDKEQPLIGVYDVTLADEMQKEFLERKGSVFAFLNRVSYDVYESSLDPSCFMNINDPETYQKYCINRSEF